MLSQPESQPTRVMSSTDTSNGRVTSENSAANSPSVSKQTMFSQTQAQPISNGRVTSADWRDDYRDISLLHPEDFDSQFFDIQPALDAASRQVSKSPSTCSPLPGNNAPYSFPPMPSLGGKVIRGLSTQSWFDPASLPAIEKAAQKVSSSDFIGQYVLQGDAPASAAPTKALPSLPTRNSARVTKKRVKSEDEEWTPEEKKSKRTAGPNKRPKRSATTRRPRVDSVPDAVEDAVTELSPHDVAMGRGGMANNHSGNKNFRKMADSLKPMYQKLHKEEKTDVSITLVQMVHKKGGRFLAKDPATDLWYEVDFKQARKKASQALREENRTERDERRKREAEEFEEYEY